MYNPQPEDITDVVLPDELEPLIEKIAKNVHDVWAQNRIADGWVYGSQRNDSFKHHPCLVPYEELSEEEKSYDRATAIGTLKLVCKFGYRLVKE